ncbi:MAG: hypothetical protein EHM79_12400 [Geobacter sp.]|nr:MAG: hypothetical protein EHM79_12400 [Geobacter sp.]
MEPLVIFSAGLVVYCGYLAILDSTKTWRVSCMETATKRAPAKKRHAVSGRQRRPTHTTEIPVGRPLLQRI